MSLMTRLCLLLTLLIPWPANAEFGRGYIATEFDPQTHEFREINKDWQEGVVFDPASGNYIITYKSEGTFSQTVFEPATKIEPVLKSKYKRAKDNTGIEYEFLVRNGKSAKQPINFMSTEISGAEPNSLGNPLGWHDTLVSTGSGANNLVWSYLGSDRDELLKDDPKGMFPAGVGTFVLQSSDLPGIGVMKLQGDRTRTTWLGGPPAVETIVGNKVQKLKAEDFVSRLVPVPKITVSSPFDPGSVLDALRAHITDDLIRLDLIDSVFANELDRTLQAAAEAARRDQTKAVRSLLHDALKLIHQAHPDIDKDDGNDGVEGVSHSNARNPHPIDRLAARVITFDIKYVEKQLK